MKLEEVLRYILYKLRNIQPTIGRTRIIKLLYLSDLIATARIGQKITDVKYQYYFYGPYSYEVIKELDKLVSEKVVDDYKNFTRAGVAHDYRINDEAFEKGSTELFNIPKEQKKIIDEVLKKYGNMRLDRLLDIVYSTSPMKKHAPGDVLL